MCVCVYVCVCVCVYIKGTKNILNFKTSKVISCTTQLIIHSKKNIFLSSTLTHWRKLNDHFIKYNKIYFVDIIALL